MASANISMDITIPGADPPTLDLENTNEATVGNIPNQANWAAMNRFIHTYYICYIYYIYGHEQAGDNMEEKRTAAQESQWRLAEEPERRTSLLCLEKTRTPTIPSCKNTGATCGFVIHETESKTFRISMQVT